MFVCLWMSVLCIFFSLKKHLTEGIFGRFILVSLLGIEATLKRELTAVVVSQKFLLLFRQGALQEGLFPASVESQVFLQLKLSLY